MAITGGCLCKAVRYVVTTAPITSRACWCRLCQYLGAGSGTVNVLFGRNALTITSGTLRDYACVADSGTRMHRRFCPDCGTHLFSSAESRPHLVIVRNGALDDRELLAPSGTIWADSAPGWARIDESLPRHAGQPPPLKPAPPGKE